MSLPRPSGIDYRQLNEKATHAARWMRDEMARKQGVLTLDEAWRGVREHFGDMCAVEGGHGNWLSKHVLSAFRKLTPDTVWDPVGRRWRAQKRNDSVNAGSRMLNARPSA